MAFNYNTSGMTVSTFFAPAARASAADLANELQFISDNPFIDTILQNVSGLFVVLNEQRQIVAINDAFLNMLGITDAEEVFGFRLGEALDCIHAHDQPNGCGTTRYCVTCGAAIAMVTSLVKDQVIDGECVAIVYRNGIKTDLFLQIRCSPITYMETRYILMFLRDETINQQRAVLERSFLHDITNTVAALQINAEYLETETEPEQIQITVDQIGQLTQLLAKEIQIQHLLANLAPASFALSIQKVCLETLIQTLENIMLRHPTSAGKNTIFSRPLPQVNLTTDTTLLLRVLQNMLINALEASNAGQDVKFMVQESNDGVIFSVWNHLPIPPEISLRLFQRNFTTKKGTGRGLGTYTMKLLGETYLKGKVSFTSTDHEGTTFQIWLPRALQ
jgi:signal transduction histidine kinase